MGSGLATLDTTKLTKEQRGIFDEVKSKVNSALADKRELAVQVKNLQTQIVSMVGGQAHVIVPVVSGGIKLGTAFGAGYFDELLTEYGVDKVFGMKAVPIAGLALMTIAEVLVDDPDLRMAIGSFGEGLALPFSGEMGRHKRQQHKKDSGAAAAQKKA